MPRGAAVGDVTGHRPPLSGMPRGGARVPLTSTPALASSARAAATGWVDGNGAGVCEKDSGVVESDATVAAACGWSAWPSRPVCHR